MTRHDILIIAPGHEEGGVLDRYLCDHHSPYVNRISVEPDISDLGKFLQDYPSPVLCVSFQGEWWTWPEIQDILKMLNDWAAWRDPKQDPRVPHMRREIHWLPHNWFMPDTWIPEFKDADEVYEWIESQLA